MPEKLDKGNTARNIANAPTTRRGFINRNNHRAGVPLHLYPDPPCNFRAGKNLTAMLSPSLLDKETKSELEARAAITALEAEAPPDRIEECRLGIAVWRVCLQHTLDHPIIK